MSLSTLTLQTVAAHQEQLVYLPAGTELRCVSGSLRLHLLYAGMTHSLCAGQTVRLADAQYARIESPNAARFSLQSEPADAIQTQKNRQGLMSLWRSLAARLMVRRGPRAA